MNMAEYNGVWVFAEQRNGELQKVSLEILGEGRRLADELGVNLTAVLLGNNVACLADILGEHGADEILVAEHEELGLKGSPTKVKKSMTKEAKGAGEVIKESAPEAVAYVLGKLKEKHYI